LRGAGKAKSWLGIGRSTVQFLPWPPLKTSNLLETSTAGPAYFGLTGFLMTGITERTRCHRMHAWRTQKVEIVPPEKVVIDTLGNEKKIVGRKDVSWLGSTQDMELLGGIRKGRNSADSSCPGRA
jgi:hypothetical protein